MKNKLLLSNFRDIKSSLKRFISLVFISLLGVGFFVGIKVSSVDMLITLDDYLDNSNMYDIKVSSPLGFSDSNIDTLKSIENVKDIKNISYRDEIVTSNNNEKIIKIIEYNKNINDIELISGSLPNKKNEIVVEEKILSDNNLKIGDTLKIKDNEIDNYKIVGVVKSPLYFTEDRGITNVGNGKINYFAYANSDTFEESDLKNLYIIVKDAKNEITSSDEYNTLISNVKKSINDLKEEQESNRFEELYGFVDTDKLSLYGWNISTRDSNSSYEDFINSTKSIENIGSIFPLVFYIVAVLVSLITMMRMVEDNRSEIGTLKSLGFSNFSIIKKYLRYSLFAIVVGSSIGVILGSMLIPTIIWSIYTKVFLLPDIILIFNLEYILLGVGIVILCIILTTLYVTINVLKEVPANLMRPKAPKSGKRVLLERVNFVWKKIKFSNKICIRNIFRYKSRVFAMIFGIMGSTALILAGFGIKDSLTDISKRQFEDIFLYDKVISFAMIYRM